MLRNIEYLLISLLFAVTAHAESSPIRNDTPTTLRDLGANLNVGANFAVDQYGQTRVGNITPGTAATSLGKTRDVNAGAADVGVMSLAVRNTSYSALTNADTDYSPIGVNAYGAILCDINGSISGTTSAQRLEDAALADGHGLVVAGGQTQDPLTIDQGTNGDAAFSKSDRAGRTLVMPYAPTSERWQACGTATASTADVAIKGAVASNRNYVTWVSCKNTSATVATTLDFKDGTTVMAVGGISQMATTAPGSFSTTFPTPLKGTANTAFNFATNISVSSVTCCAGGYISVD